MTTVVTSMREYTTREFSRSNAQVLRQIAESGQPAVITDWGRPAFVIVPIPEEVRTRALEAAVAEVIADMSGSPVKLA